MNKKQEIQQALTAAMKARDEDTKRTLRLVMASVKLAEVETGEELDDARILSILQKEVKTRDDMIEESKKSGTAMILCRRLNGNLISLIISSPNR